MPPTVPSVAFTISIAAIGSKAARQSSRRGTANCGSCAGASGDGWQPTATFWPCQASHWPERHKPEPARGARRAGDARAPQALPLVIELLQRLTIDGAQDGHGGEQ